MISVTSSFHVRPEQQDESRRYDGDICHQGHVHHKPIHALYTQTKTWNAIHILIGITSNQNSDQIIYLHR